MKSISLVTMLSFIIPKSEFCRLIVIKARFTFFTSYLFIIVRLLQSIVMVNSKWLWNPRVLAERKLLMPCNTHTVPWQWLSITIRQVHLNMKTTWRLWNCRTRIPFLLDISSRRFCSSCLSHHKQFKSVSKLKNNNSPHNFQELVMIFCVHLDTLNHFSTQLYYCLIFSS